MRGSWLMLAVVLVSMVCSTSCARGESGGRAPASSSTAGGAPTATGALAIVPDIAARRAQLVRKPLTVDLGSLPDSERKALDHLVAAAKVIDEVFLLQAWRDNPAFAERVAALTGPLAAPAQDYYRIMGGPWDRLKAYEPFLGTAKRPAGVGFYPEDLSQDELERWIKTHPGDQPALTSSFSVVEREGRKLVAKPYSEVYKPLLDRAAAALRAAAAATDNASLKRFAELRASAFASNDYFDSDMAWMDLDSAIEVVIGPYETYEDSLMGYKAAFEAFICVTQPTDSERLAVFKKWLPFLESHLPIPDEHKNTTRGGESPIRVADLVFSAGDARKGVQTLAFNLPNDERVREAKGSKKVLLKNMMLAKYEAILMPIASRVLPVKPNLQVDFESYFHFILFHELSHGLGPGRITVKGRQTEARLELKELYPAIEEAKADVLSVFALGRLAAEEVVPVPVVRALPWSYVAGLFRAARFGTTEAHGLGVVIQANYLLDKGAIVIDKDGRFAPELATPKAFSGALKALATELLMIEAEGSYVKAQALVKRYGKVRPEMAKLLAHLESVPVDVDPVFEADGE